MMDTVRNLPLPSSFWLTWYSRIQDPKDNKFLALAFECEADAIVSSDEDLLVLHPWNEVRILGLADFLNEVR